MKTVAIVGAGELGATLARLLADREQVRRILLIDPDAGRAQGKALDLMQSGPVEGSDTRLDGVAELTGHVDAVVIADPTELEGVEVTPLRRAEFLRGLVPRLGTAPLVIAGANPCRLVTAARERGVPADRLLGSAPVAWSAALRRLLAEELKVEPSAVTGVVVGYPPDLVPLGVTLGGTPLEGAGLSALGRAVDRLKARAFGPVSLAAAGAHVLRALAASRVCVLPLVLGNAVAVPARIAAGRVFGPIAFELSPRERVLFDNAAERAGR
jgi:malate dehydrogenase